MKICYSKNDLLWLIVIVFLVASLAAGVGFITISYHYFNSVETLCNVTDVTAIETKCRPDMFWQGLYRFDYFVNQTIIDHGYVAGSCEYSRSEAIEKLPKVGTSLICYYWTTDIQNVVIDDVRNYWISALGLFLSFVSLTVIMVISIVIFEYRRSKRYINV